MRQVAYGLVGFGGIAENRIAKEGFALDAKRFPHADLPMTLYGATDINQHRKEVVQELGLQWYSTYDEMLSDPNIEAIYVATSNSTHFEIAMQALKANKHVIIEKPFTTTVEDAKELIAYASQKNLSLSVNLMMRKNSYNVVAKELIEEKCVGEVDFATFHMEFLYGESVEEASSWRCSSTKEFGGPIGDTGAHCLDLAEYFFSQPISSVQCTYYPKRMNIAVEEGAIILCTLKNGLKGTVRVAFNQARGGILGTIGDLGFEVWGEKGFLKGFGTMFQLSGHSDEPVPISLQLKTLDYEKEYHLSEVKNIYQEQISEHALSIINNQPLSGEDGLKNVALVLACHKSAQNGGEEVFL